MESGPVGNNQSSTNTMQNLIFWADLKKHLGLSSEDKQDFFTSLIETASATVEEWCEQPIGQEASIGGVGNVQFTFGGNGCGSYVHGYHPATAVKLEYQSEVGGAWTVIADGYESVEDNGVPMLRYDGGFDSSLRYRVTLLVGYVVGTSSGNTEIPKRVQDACRDMVVQEWKRSEQGDRRFGIRTVADSDGSLGSRTTTYYEMDDATKAAIVRYRRRGL